MTVPNLSLRSEAGALTFRTPALRALRVGYEMEGEKLETKGPCESHFSIMKCSL